MPEDRRSGSARREDDQALDFLADRLRDFEQRFERAVDRLEDELDKLRDATSDRVRELEEFHIEDRTRAREQIAKRMRRSQWIAGIGSGVGIVGVALAAVEHFAHI